jgi:type IX secretion system PorP/SprF family membrane protein
MRTNLFVIAICLVIQTGYSQEDSVYQINRYGTAAFTEIATNPAFTGLEGRNVLDLSYELFHPGWWSIKQFKADYATSFGKKNRLGVGTYYFYEEIEYSKEHEFNASLAYKYIFNKKLDINFGLSAITYYRMVTDLEKLRNGAADPNDPLLQGSKYINDRLDYNTGIWLNYQNLYFGFSFLDFFTIDLQGDNTEFFDENASTHINAGYDYSLNKKWHISPTLYILNVFGVNDLYEFGLFADYSNLVFTGITFRLKESISYDIIGFRCGVLLAKRIRLTAGYEFATDEDEIRHLDYDSWNFGLRLQY